MYKYLSKAAKKELIRQYTNTERGKNLSVTLNRLVGEGLFCLVAFVVILISVLRGELAAWYWIFIVLTFIAGVVFLVGQQLIRRKEYNKYFRELSKTEKNKLTKSK